MNLNFKESDELFDCLNKPTKIVLEPRSMFVKIGALLSVKGSAYMEYGNTKLLVTIDPPREVNSNIYRKNETLGIILCSVKHAPFAMQYDHPIVIARRERILESSLKRALEPVVCRSEFPNFQLEIKVLILDDDGCLLSTAINCAAIALIEGGIPIYDLITSSTLCYYRNVVFVNPEATVEQLISNKIEKGDDDSDDYGIVVTATLATTEQFCSCYQTGSLTFETFDRLCEDTMKLNKRMLDPMRHVLINTVKRHIRDDGSSN